MKISYKWLKQYVEFDWTPEELAHRLTMAGLEVEGIEPFETVKGSLKGVVVGEVKTCIKHPGADKLSLTTVDVGAGALLPIVCGAPNVRAGQKVLVATVGATLYPVSGESFEIKKAKIRGEESQGMICAEDEIGLGHSHDGIMVLPEDTVVGTPAAKLFDLESDYTLEIGLTPNRVDAASHYGVARDVAALLGMKAIKPALDGSWQGSAPCAITISLPEEDKCPKYVGIMIRGVKVGESPDWLKNRLKSIGSRPINNVVDATNFVLHELGHPLHAFDADRIRGNQIIVQSPAHDLEFVTLDSQVRKLLAGKDLMICDAEGPVALAGIMGGQNSEVEEGTTNIFLESAWFDPRTIRTTGARLGMKTDASFRFERGADANMALFAAQRCTELIMSLAGGTPSVISDVQKRDFPPYPVRFDLHKANKMMGYAFQPEQLREILERLEVKVSTTSEAGIWNLEVPTYRVDVLRQQDVLEDILRIYGYNNVPVGRMSHLSYDLDQKLDVNALLQKYLEYTAATGWNEILTNPLVPAKYATDQTANLVNNLSEDLAVMRPDFLNTGLDVVAYNQNRKTGDLRLVEHGKTYAHVDGNYQEREWLVMYMTGMAAPAHWSQKPAAATLYTMIRELERLQAWFGFEGEVVELENDPQLSYGVALMKGTREVARTGKVSTALAKAKDIKGDVFFLQADWAELLRLYRKAKVVYQPLPKFPAVKRDISMLVPAGVRFRALAASVKSTNPKIVREVSITDVYEGPNIEAGKRSYLISITMMDDQKTMTDDVTDKLMERITEKLTRDLGVDIRK